MGLCSAANVDYCLIVVNAKSPNTVAESRNIRIIIVLVTFLQINIITFADMKRVIILAYWLLSILILSLLIISLDYSFGQALLISIMFLPATMAVSYFLPRISFANRKEGIRNSIFACLGILTGIILIEFCTHLYLSSDLYTGAAEYPKILWNPLFFGLIITILSLGHFEMKKLLDKKYGKSPNTITFSSRYRKITLPDEDIMYLESRDSEVWLYSSDGSCYPNITPISQWERMLGESFIRIHRSYLVNIHLISGMEDDMVIVCGIELPVSRKYMKDLKETLLLHRLR